MRKLLLFSTVTVSLLALPSCSNTATKATSPVLSGSGGSIGSALSTPIPDDIKTAGDILCGAYGAYYNGLKIFPQYAPSDPTLQAVEDTAANICSNGLIGSTPLATLQALAPQVLKLIADQAIKMAAAKPS